MNAWVLRRAVGASVAAGVVVFLAAAAAWRAAALYHAAFVTGYALLAAVIFLALFNLRKKFPAPPLGLASLWLQTHIYTGLAAVAVFALHIEFRWPSGGFETLLYTLFVATCGSGLLGLYWTRTDPRRLNLPPEEAIYERIPQLRDGVRRSARELLVQAARSGASNVLADFYTDSAAALIERPRSWTYRLWPTSRTRRRLLQQLEDQDRYLDDAERVVKRRLAALIRRTDDLDYQAALQFRLKAWLFVHLGLTYALLSAVALHVALVHAFHGGW